MIRMGGRTGLPVLLFMKFGIVCDSSADLAPEILEDRQIRLVPFYVSLDGSNYQKEGVELTQAQLYGYMREHPDCFPKTSLPTIPDYGEAFAAFAREGLDVLCICLTE